MESTAQKSLNAGFRVVFQYAKKELLEQQIMKIYYWIAINGASVTMSSLPLIRTIPLKPVPQLLLDSDSAREAEEAQHFFLAASIPECRKRLKELARKAKRQKIVSIAPETPEPPTSGPTSWVPTMEEPNDRP